jgi:hypothetical protein
VQHNPTDRLTGLIASFAINRPVDFTAGVSRLLFCFGATNFITVEYQIHLFVQVFPDIENRMKPSVFI